MSSTDLVVIDVFLHSGVPLGAVCSGNGKSKVNGPTIEADRQWCPLPTLHTSSTSISYPGTGINYSLRIGHILIRTQLLPHWMLVVV